MGGKRMQNEVENKPGSPAGLQLLTKKQVANLLACSCRMVERLVASGTLTAVKIRGAVRFRSSDIEQIMMKGAT
jgi:excisionase family DNA binding protein